MKFHIFLFIIFLIRIISKEKGKNYAVLVAGSNNYINYRHQADVFHLYHILLEKGFEKENIIVFAYDDIVNNTKNPFKGKVFNAQTGKNYYENVIIDYKTDNVHTEEQLRQRCSLYESQVKAYTMSLCRIFSMPVKESVLYFLSCGRTVTIENT